jgi:hypothetical protein
LPRLQRDDAPLGQRRFVDVGGAIIEVIGDQYGIDILGVADGVGGFPLPSFDRVEEDGHGGSVIG